MNGLSAADGTADSEKQRAGLGGTGTVLGWSHEWGLRKRGWYFTLMGRCAQDRASSIETAVILEHSRHSRNGCWVSDSIEQGCAVGLCGEHFIQ